jgi:citrate lyase subunit beta/citryl-CoA lyase
VVKWFAMKESNLYRSYLFVPCGNLKFIEKIRTLGIQNRPDFVILDLEDSVPDDRKREARNKVAESIRLLGGGAKIGVRVNDARSEYVRDDVRQTVFNGVTCIFLPKTDGVPDLQRVDTLISESEVECRLERGRVELVPLVETARGTSNLKDICSYGRRVSAVGFGAGDYSLDMGLVWSREGIEYDLPRRLIPMEARAACLKAIDGVYMELEDMRSFEEDCHLSRRLGYTGRMVVNPAQVLVANRSYLPTKEEVVWARKAVRSYRRALATGAGAVKVDGQLIDKLHYKLAKQILERVE